MVQQLFVNLPIQNLKKSVAFFTKLGFTFNAQFTNETTTCMIIGPNNFVMLAEHSVFQTFTPLPVADATKATQVLMALALESREAVDKHADIAKEAGATEFKEPQDLGFMYVRSYQDLDGHIWEPFFMDPKFIQKG